MSVPDEADRDGALAQPNGETAPVGGAGFHIGPFVLETLTTGMYGKSSNALREYVQNAFDATRAAISAGVLAPRGGRVVVMLLDDAIVVEDNGIGLAVGAAWSTLTAIGASKKDRARDAGFRGIGRLAAIAFCEQLVFRTKVAGERFESVVTYDCVGLRAGMMASSGSSLTELLNQTVRYQRKDAPDVAKHYMIVTIRGLEEAPPELRSVDMIRDYLSETSPIPFDPRWPAATQIVGRAAEAGHAFETIDLLVGRSMDSLTPVYKPYGAHYRKARKGRATGGTTTLERVDYHSGKDWWCWVGVPRDSGLLVDERTAGLRVRVKNIQVDGTTILDELFATENPSYDRFNKFHVGEIHIDPKAVVPNARRDGFEQDARWSSIQEEIYLEVCGPLSQEAYVRSEKGKKAVDVVKAKVERLTQATEREMRRGMPRDTTRWATALARVEKVRAQVSNAVLEADPEATSALRAQLDVVSNLKDRLEDKLEPNAELRLRREIRAELLAQVETVIQPYLDTTTYARVRDLLAKIR